MIIILGNILYTLDCEIFHSLDILRFKIDSIRNDINVKFGFIEEYNNKPLIEVKEARIMITPLIRLIEIILFTLVVMLSMFSLFILTLASPVITFSLFLLCLYIIAMYYITDGEIFNIVYDKGCDWVNIIISSSMFKRISNFIGGVKEKCIIGLKS